MIKNDVVNGEIVIYNPDDSVNINVRVDGDTVWLTQAQMSELFGVQRQAITKHLKNNLFLVNYNAKQHVPFWN